MRATTHASYCTDHVADHLYDYDPDDQAVVSEGFCRDTAISHGVELVITEPNPGDPVACEVYSKDDNWLTPAQMRDVAALLIDKAARLDAVLDVAGAVPAPAASKSPGLQELQCSHGHTWTRQTRPGRRPRTCPEHAAGASSPRPAQESPRSLRFCDDGAVMDADGDIVRGADQWTAAFVEWDRPVAAEILTAEPSAVGLSAHHDAEGQVWLYVTATSPEMEGEAQLSKSSAKRLAGEITRMVSKL